MRHKCNNVKTMELKVDAQYVPHTRQLRRVALVASSTTMSSSTQTATPQAMFTSLVARNPQAYADARAQVEEATNVFIARATSALPNEGTPSVR